MPPYRPFAGLFFLLALLSACSMQPGGQPTGSGATTSTPVARVPSYTIEENFKNVYNIDFLHTHIPEGKARELLARNSFVVLPAQHDEFFSLYEKNRYNKDPNIVTSDSILHTYHLLFDHVLMKSEEEKLAPLALTITQQMLQESMRQYNLLTGTEWQNAAKRNVAFFAVAHKLLEPEADIPPLVEQEVTRELQLIASHNAVAESPVMNMGSVNARGFQTPWGEITPGAVREDYTQYIPRGHYERTPQLQRYFRAMMWYGRQNFRFKNPDEVRSALLITRALEQETTRSAWERLYDITAFFVGESDDLTYQQLEQVADTVYKGSTVQEMANDERALQQFMQQAGTLPAPKINSIPVLRADAEPDREKEIKGFRFMGQRFTLDAAVMQRLICRDVGTKDGNPICGGGIPGSRMLPSGLDVAAAMGSDEAYSLLRAQGETDYLHYQENMTQLRDFIARLDAKTWTQNLYWSWLYAIDPLLDVPGEGYPLFMRNGAWIRKQLQTFLGSWAELKHDTILYTKQPYAELGGGGDIPEKDDRGYVEPVPLVYDRLAMLTAMTRDGLAARTLLPDSQRENLNRMEELSNRLQSIAEKELSTTPLSAEDYELIRSYGGQIEHLWYEVNKELIQQSGMSTAEYLSENPAAIVADVATDPNGSVLEVATGKVYELFVLVPVEGRLKLLNGTVYSYYEFPWPITDRLTDTRWRTLLKNNDPALPQQPAWTENFIAR